MSRVEKRMFALLLVFNIIICAWFLSRNGIMSDESDYYSYTIRWAHGDASRIRPTDDSKSPMLFPVLIPLVAKTFVHFPDDPYGFRWLKIGGMFMYLYVAITSFFTMGWMRSIVGAKKWLIPLMLMLFDPLLICHSMLVGSDVASMAMLLALTYCANRYAQSRENRYWYWFCLFTGLAFVTKASMVLTAVVLPFTIIACHFNKQLPGIGVKNWAWKILLYGCTIWFTINVAYYFDGTFSPIANWPELSDSFKSIKQSIGAFASWPSPLPIHYVSAFDALKYHAAVGGYVHHPDNTYIGIIVLGKHFLHGSVWYYYLVTFFIKWPLLIWMLFGATVFFVMRQFRKMHFKKHFLLWVTPLFFLVQISINNPFQIGIRHALILYPFLYIIIAPVFVMLWKKRTTLMRMLLMLHMISIAVFWPNLMAYTNELIWPKTKVYYYLNDSSIHYGHDDFLSDEFITKHPEYQKPDSIPKPGKYAVIMERVTLPWNHWKLNWLNNFEPEGLYKHNVMLYNITEADIEWLKTKNNEPTKLYQ